MRLESSFPMYFLQECDVRELVLVLCRSRRMDVRFAGKVGKECNKGEWKAQNTTKSEHIMLTFSFALKARKEHHSVYAYEEKKSTHEVILRRRVLLFSFREKVFNTPMQSQRRSELSIDEPNKQDLSDYPRRLKELYQEATILSAPL
jgi:hypothetical protein